jgi:phosphotransferase system enzyme I (PtsI)
MKKIRGIGASRGIAIGPAFRFQHIQLDFKRRGVKDTEAEWQRFRDAAGKAKDQLREVQARAEKAAGSEEAALFGAHAEMLEDPELLGAVRRAIKNEAINAEAAVYDAAESYARKLEALESEYLRARAADVRDVRDRVLRILLDVAKSPTEGLNEPSVILAHDLAPSDTALLDKSLTLGFCTAGGSSTSHTAILARSLGLPAVVGAGPEITGVPNDTTLVLDGSEGVVVVEPDDETVERYEQHREQVAAILDSAQDKAGEPAVTRDGHRVEVVANIGDVEGAEAALHAGAEGVGLLRTEFLYLERDHLPDEKEQFRAYRAIADVFGNLPVVLRTLDIGGDKELPYLDLPEEMNPFLGVRAIRLCLARPELIKPQLRAALRAGVGRNIKVMFPLITALAELRAARKLLDNCRSELEDEGKATAEETEIGIMVETPAAAVMADRLAGEVDFFSIGTNDLSQYTMAADRTNKDVASLLTGFQPAVLRLVRDTIAAAHDHGIWVGLCGELAGEPLAIPILLGLGVDELSMNPAAVALAKQIIRQLSLDETKKLAEDVLELDSPDMVKEVVRERMPAADLI